MDLRIIAVLGLVAFFTQPANGEEPGHSKYAGQEWRAVTSLSAEDIAELRRGGGWGLAKPAELNGIPGPAHLLELSDEIPLSADQIRLVTALQAEMRQKAIPLGERLIDAERALDQLFRRRDMSPQRLRSALDRIGKIRTELRFVHLETHFRTPEILSAAQIARYNALRGYGLEARSKGTRPGGHGMH